MHSLTEKTIQTVMENPRKKDEPIKSQKMYSHGEATVMLTFTDGTVAVFTGGSSSGCPGLWYTVYLPDGTEREGMV